MFLLLFGLLSLMSFFSSFLMIFDNNALSYNVSSDWKRCIWRQYDHRYSWVFANTARMNVDFNTIHCLKVGYILNVLRLGKWRVTYTMAILRKEKVSGWTKKPLWEVQLFTRTCSLCSDCTWTIVSRRQHKEERSKDRACPNSIIQARISE